MQSYVKPSMDMDCLLIGNIGKIDFKASFCLINKRKSMLLKTPSYHVSHHVIHNSIKTAVLDFTRVRTDLHTCIPETYIMTIYY